MRQRRYGMTAPPRDPPMRRPEVEVALGHRAAPVLRLRSCFAHASPCSRPAFPRCDSPANEGASAPSARRERAPKLTLPSRTDPARLSTPPPLASAPPPKPGRAGPRGPAPASPAFATPRPEQRPASGGATLMPTESTGSVGASSTRSGSTMPPPRRLTLPRFCRSRRRGPASRDLQQRQPRLPLRSQLSHILSQTPLRLTTIRQPCRSRRPRSV